MIPTLSRTPVAILAAGRELDTHHFVYSDGMFERYTESARRVLFFARYETSMTGSLVIESEHLLLGLLRDPGPIVRRLLAGSQASLEQLRQEVENRIVFRERVVTSVEIQRLVERIRTTLPTPHESNALLRLLHVELAALRGRFS